MNNTATFELPATPPVSSTRLLGDTVKFRTIVADPPWPFAGTGHWKRAKGYISKPPYPTMKLDEICALPVGNLAAEDCHLWLWTDNVNLHNGFHVMEAWGFKYLAPIHWIKPSGCGCWWIHRTQTMLFGYKKKCRFPMARFRPNIITTSRDPKRHSEKPEETYKLIEDVSAEPRLELFARRTRPGWNVWGNELPNDVNLVSPNSVINKPGSD